MHAPRLPVLLTPLALALGACSDSVPTPVAPTRAATGAPAADFGPAPVATDYAWSQGDDPVSMGPAAGRLCFITGVGGKFDGPNEWVRVKIAFDGQWELRGHSQQTDPSATISGRARCIAASSYTVETSVVSTGAVVSQWLGGTACALTGVGGKFDDLDGRVHIIPGSPHLGTIERIEAYAGQTGGYVTGYTRCATDPSVTRLSTEWSWQYPTAPVTLTGSLFTQCALSGIAGQFRSTADWVRVRKTDPSYELLGAPHTGIKAWAACMW